MIPSGDILYRVGMEINFFDVIMENAVHAHASDIHIDPGALWLFIYFRIDGMVTLYDKFNLSTHEGIIARIKVLARLPIDERRLPKDGRFRWTNPSAVSSVEVRVSMMPTVFGENAVLRLFDPNLAFLTLEELGFSSEHRDSIEQALAFSSGLIIVTGPTGSGKTTALYAMLARLNNGKRNIITIEDPVERRITGIRQIEIGGNTLLTFPSVLRSVLRQDPDVLMIGEVRDKESAELALQSALTGHLVLTTLHASSADGVEIRLRQMGIPNYLIESTLRLAVSTKLVPSTHSGKGRVLQSGCILYGSAEKNK